MWRHMQKIWVTFLASRATKCVQKKFDFDFMFDCNVIRKGFLIMTLYEFLDSEKFSQFPLLL